MMKSFFYSYTPGEKTKQERYDAWQAAIGLQAVDGLQLSDYLQQIATLSSRANK